MSEGEAARILRELVEADAANGTASNIRDARKQFNRYEAAFDAASAFVRSLPVRPKDSTCRD